MLEKYSVKKPYTVVVGVILILILGVISFTHMTTDLLPSMNFPYVIVYTTDVGATPEQIESDVTRPLESTFATLTDIKNISSTSSDNLSLVILEFNDTADMNTAMIEINSKVTEESAKWSDSVGAPVIMKINPDMLPVSIVSVAKDGMDIYALSEYVEDEIIPEYESLNGVARVTASGIITREVDITIDQDRIDVLNAAILREVDSELADAEQKINDAEAQIVDGKSQLARARRSAMSQIDDAAEQFEDSGDQLAAAVTQLTAQRGALQKQLDDANAAIAQMEQLSTLTPEQKQAMQEMMAQVGKLEADKAALEARKTRLETVGSVSVAIAQRDSAAARREELIAQRGSYEKLIEDLKATDPAAIQAEIDSLNNQLTTAQSELTAAQNVLNQAIIDRDAAQQSEDPTLTEKQAAVDKAQSDVSAKSAAVEALNRDIQAKQSALTDAQTGDIQTRINTAQSDIDSLNQRIGTLDKEIAELEEIISSGDDITQLNESIAALDSAISKIKESKEYKAVAALPDEDTLNQQYAQAMEGKSQLEAGIAQIDAMLDKLNRGIIPGGMIEGIDEDTSLSEAKSKLASARRKAVSGFEEAETKLNDAEAEIAEARKTFEEQRDEALKNAGLDGVITLQTVGGIIGAQNLSMPAGYIYDVSEDQYLVRIGNKFASLDELKNTKLFSLGMESVDDVRLIDVADVEITDNRAETFTKVNGQDGILLSIEKQSTFSTTDVAKRIAGRTEDLTRADGGLHIVDLFNQGDYIDIIVDSVLSNLVQGGLLAVLVLMLFLMDPRPTIIIACSIPLSVVAAFVCMYFTGVTLNVLSLSGLALGVGMLVDNSIVSIENIYRLRNEEKLPILTACVQGVKQVSGALFSSTLTTICVFLPVVFVTGMARDLFSDIGLTITYSLLASLVVAVTLVPSMAAAVLKKQRRAKKQRVFGLIQRFYTLLLRGALKAKALVLILAVALLAMTLLQVPSMGMSFMPQVNSTQMTASLTQDPEVDEAERQSEAMALMTRVMEVEGIDTVGLNAGGGMMSMSASGGGGDSLSYYIIVDETAGRSNVDIAKDIQSIAEEMSLDLSVQTSTMDISMLTGTGITVNISGDDIQALQRAAIEVAALATDIEGVDSVDDGTEDAVPQLSVTVDKEKAINKGLTVGQVMQFIATKLAGKTEIAQATLDGRSMSIYLADGRNAKLTPDDLENLQIESVMGNLSEMVRIGDVADITETTSMTSISRKSQQRTSSVTIMVADGYSANHVSDALEEKLSKYTAPKGCEISLAGENETVMSIMQDLVFMVGIAIALIFLIMVAQFQSFKSPIIVLFTIPLAFTGGLAALLYTHMDLSIVAMVGFLVLSGVVVNNGIVFVDSVNQLRIGGMSKRDALLETGRLRLRPILMTALTTILGMSTMALGTGMGAEMMQPMAVVTIGGLSYATLMTLFVVPVMYDIVNGNKMKAREIEMIREASGMNAEEKPEGKRSKKTKQKDESKQEKGHRGENNKSR